MGLFKRTKKYSKSSKGIDSKIKGLDEDLKKTNLSSPDQIYSAERIEEILSEQVYEDYAEEVEYKCEEEIQKVKERHNQLVKVQESIEHVKNKEVKNIFSELYQSEVEKVVEEYVSKYSSEIVTLREDLFHEVQKTPVVDLSVLESKIDLLTAKYNKLSEGLLNEPVTGIDNGVTFEQLKNHYQLLVGRLQEQLATIGGGGETRLQYLDDIVGIATNASAYDGKFLKYDHTVGKFVFDTGNSGAQGAQGAQGVQGTAGSPGSTGSQGVQGAQGLQGVQGSPGADSTVAGPQGAQGAQGVQGAQGTPGVLGGDGAQGAQGVQGAQGEQGVQGAQGSSGAREYTVTNNGASDYVIDGSNDPTLNLLRGFTYTFNINASGHPFYIQTSSGAYNSGNVYTSGVTGNGTQVGTLTFEVPYNAPSTLYYVCQFHSSMNGTISVTDVGPTGAQGEQGAAGAQGSQGIQGAQGIPGSGADSFWQVDSVGIHTLGVVGIGTTNSRYTLEVGNVGYADTSLWVNGNARVTGILSVGQGTVTIDGVSDEVTVGSGITINSSGLNVTGVITASQFVGNVVGYTTEQKTNTIQAQVNALGNNLNIIGFYDASVGVVTSLTVIGQTRGYVSVGDTLPNAGITTGDYFIISTGGTNVGIASYISSGISTSYPGDWVVGVSNSEWNILSYSQQVVAPRATNADFADTLKADSSVNTTGIITANSFYGNGVNLSGVVTSLVGYATEGYVDSASIEIINDTTPQLGGNLDLNNRTINGTGNINITGSSRFNGPATCTSDLDVEGLLHVTGTNQLRFGAGQNTFLYKGTDNNSYLQTNNNEFRIGAPTLRLQSYASVGFPGENFLVATKDGSVDIYYNNSKKFETTNTGSIVTGILTATSFSGSGANLTSLPAGQLTGALPAIDGSALTGIVATGSGIEVRDSGSVVGTASTIDFSTNLNVAFGSGIATVSGVSSVTEATTAYGLTGSPNVTVRNLTVRHPDSLGFEAKINVGAGITISSSDGVLVNTPIKIFGDNRVVDFIAETTNVDNESGLRWFESNGGTPLMHLDYNGANNNGTFGQLEIKGYNNDTTSNEIIAIFDRLGRVGIGSTQPTSRLTVTGDTLVSGVVTATTFYGNFSGSITDATNLTGGYANASQLNVTGITTISTGRIQADASSNLRFGNIAAGSGSVRNIAIGDQVLTSLSGGSGRNIGIGELSYYDTTTGQYNIGIGINAGQKITSGSYNVIIGGYNGQTGLDLRTSSNNVVIADGEGNIRQYIDSNGNVGIKTTVVTEALTVAGIVSATSFYGTLNAGQLTGALPALDGSALVGVTATGSGIEVRDSGSVVGTASTIDFGSNLSVTFGSGIATVSGASLEIINDTTPQLGGNLDLNGQTINGTGRINITGNSSFNGITTIGGVSKKIDFIPNNTDGNTQIKLTSNNTQQFTGSLLNLSNSSNATEFLHANLIPSPTGGETYFAIQKTNASGVYQQQMAIYNYDNDTWLFKTGLSNVVGLSIDNGRVGIGTDIIDATAKLTVGGAVTATTYYGSGANLTSLPAGQLTGALPAIDGSALLNVNATGSGIVVEDNGSNIGSARTVNFGTGLDVTYSSSGIATVSSSGGSLQTRTIVSGTTDSLANLGIGNTNITGFKSYALMKVGLSTAGWLRLYTDSSSRDADVSRSVGEDPSPGSGVIAEVITTGISTNQIISPFVMGGNLNDPADTTIYASIKNLSGSTQAITANLTILQLEA